MAAEKKRKSVDGAATVENAVVDLAAERRMRPLRRIPDRHDVGMSREA